MSPTVGSVAFSPGRSAGGRLALVVALNWLAPIASGQEVCESVIRGQVLDHLGRPVAGASVGVALNGRAGIFYSGSDVQSSSRIRIVAPDMAMTTIPKCYGSVGETFDDGSFRFENVAVGTFGLFAFHSERGAAIVEDVAVESNGAWVTVYLDEPTFVEVDVSKWNGDAGEVEQNAVENWLSSYVIVRPDADDYGIRRPIRMSGIAGRATDDRKVLGPFAGSGKWVLNYSNRSRSGLSANIDATVLFDLIPGETTLITLDSEQGVRLDGYVLDEDYNPKRNVFVNVTSKTDDGHEITVAGMTDEQGFFSIHGVRAGDVSVEGVGRGLRFERGIEIPHDVSSYEWEFVLGDQSCDLSPMSDRRIDEIYSSGEFEETLSSLLDQLNTCGANDETLEDQIVALGFDAIDGLVKAFVRTDSEDFRRRIRRIGMLIDAADYVSNTQGFLGVSTRGHDRVWYNGGTVCGIAVRLVIEDSAAEAAGVLCEDRIVSVDGQPLGDCDQIDGRALSDALVSRRPGTRISLVIARGFQEVTLKATLTAPPMSVALKRARIILNDDSDSLEHARTGVDIAAWWDAIVDEEIEYRDISE
jgi:PDZ domain